MAPGPSSSPSLAVAIGWPAGLGVRAWRRRSAWAWTIPDPRPGAVPGAGRPPSVPRSPACAAAVGGGASGPRRRLTRPADPAAAEATDRAVVLPRGGPSV
jgi:hypothetical protein